MRILIVDGQGGGIGKALVERLRSQLPAAELIAVGTNSLAASAMIRAGASLGATGENAVLYNSSRADVIAGPMGIVAANAMLGEVTAAMAAAITGSDAQKVLVPVDRCRIHVAGNVKKPVIRLVEDAVEWICRFVEYGGDAP